MIPISHDEKSLNNPEPRISSKELLSNINNLQNGGVFRYYDSIFQDASCTLPLKIKHLVNETSGVCTSPSNNNLCQPIAGAGYSKGYKCLVFSAPPTVEPGYLALVFHPNKDCSGIASNTGMSIIPSGVSQISYFPMFECSRGFSANTSVMGNTHLFIMYM
ncbi:hypothetical protein C9374_005777 [Naegleria lovaniensis]|uniref:Uncharacterized protein n=1 Tax=Naegleria lovaniensis TaxID=51637 RepID=A0AA88GKQ3_NAELO|nr:uncharacterized protein C9374_005777 [Naegleria lovaniensis]KAG2381985.1 hypothetical protein C9374_005777 [Naegleria lovaniensis]